MLDCSKANKLLKWKAVWGIEKTLEKTIVWYKDFYTENKVNSQADLLEFVTDAQKANIQWAK
jgi:CDP-glucose 4,6-dehydratase